LVFEGVCQPTIADELDRFFSSLKLQLGYFLKLLIQNGQRRHLS